MSHWQAQQNARQLHDRNFQVSAKGTQKSMLCKDLEIPCVIEGEQKEPEGKLKIKKVLWRESDKEIKAEMENLTKSDI